MYKLLKKTTLTENVIEYVFYAPKVAVSGKPGQFVLFRIDGLGERVPITICDTDPKRGTITLLIQSVGASTLKLAQISEGESILDIAGPLGKATDLNAAQNILLVAGGIGVAVLYPQAKLLKSQGKKVTCIMGARKLSLLAYLDKMKEVCDEVIIMTDDGSCGRKGLVTVAVDELVNIEKRVFDAVFAVGPIRMMQAVCNVTKKGNVHTIVSMNPIMIDGTGMCGGCRLTVDGKVKYACVDGPEFDGHLVDFDEIDNRSRFFMDIEKEHICRLTGGKKND